MKDEKRIDKLLKEKMMQISDSYVVINEEKEEDDDFVSQEEINDEIDRDEESFNELMEESEGGNKRGRKKGSKNQNELLKGFNINDINFDDPEQIKYFKKVATIKAYKMATSKDPKDHKSAAALKNVIDICLELERDLNVDREMRLAEIENKLNESEGIIEDLLTENQELKSKIAMYEQERDSNGNDEQTLQG